MTEATQPPIRSVRLGEGVNKKNIPKITEGNPAISKRIPKILPCSSKSIISQTTSYFPLTKSFNVNTDNTSVVFKIKAWQVFLISIIPVSILGGIMFGAEGFGGFFAQSLIWGGIGLGIHYLVRNAGNKEIAIYGVVSVFLVLGMWYVAISTGLNMYYLWAVGLTTVAVVTGMYQSITRTRQKKGKGIT